MIEYLLSKNLIPQSLLRLGIGHEISDRLKTENTNWQENKEKLISDLKQSPIALSTDEANKQHYEVPTDFFKLILGPKLKYSACSYHKATNLKDAEIEMIELVCERADIKDGQSILDLGCGWGSMTLSLAKKYPKAQITAVSNSATQKSYINSKAKEQGFNNITVITEDINQLNLDQKFDRIISIEMIEHIRNYQSLFDKLASWLVPEGKLFIHHFCHKYLLYTFDSNNSWMAKHFFQDGMMPSEDLLDYFCGDLKLLKKWQVNGRHYSQTCYDWLENLIKHKKDIINLFSKHYDDPVKHYVYWKIFLLSCAKLFEHKQGNEWYVSHVLYQA